MGFQWDRPFGIQEFAIEHGPVIVDVASKIAIFHSYVC